MEAKIGKAEVKVEIHKSSCFRELKVKNRRYTWRRWRRKCTRTGALGGLEMEVQEVENNRCKKTLPPPHTLRQASRRGHARSAGIPCYEFN